MGPVAEPEAAAQRKTKFAPGERIVLSEARWAELRKLAQSEGVKPPELPKGLKLPRERKHRAAAESHS